MRILIASEYKIFSEALSLLLVEAGFSVCTLVDVSTNEFSEATFHECDAIILTDPAFKLPVVVALEKIQSRNNGVPVVVVSAARNYSASLFLQYSVRAIVSRDAEVHELYTAVKKVSSGHHYFSPTVAEELAINLCNSRYKKARLSSRESEVVILIAKGWSTCKIAATLSISPKTVSTHKNNIKSRLGLHSNSDIIRYAIEEGWISPKD